MVTSWLLTALVLSVTVYTVFESRKRPRTSLVVLASISMAIAILNLVLS